MKVSSITLRLAGVCGRTLRKKSSLIIIVVICFSFSLIHTASNSYTKSNTRKANDNAGEDVILTPEVIEEALIDLNRTFSTIDGTCGKLARLGGNVACDCDEKKCSLDGAKLVCLDPYVRPVPGDCFAMNFGIGFDLSFDAAMVNYGCRVVAFDPTNTNMTDRVYQAMVKNSVLGSRIQPFIPGRSLGYALSQPNSRYHDKEFHALDLGLAKKDFTQFLNLTIDKIHYSGNVAAFFTYKSILNLLDQPRVDLLKLDIEGVEWEVFYQLLQSPDGPRLLRPVRQILLETHFEFLAGDSDAEKIMQGIWRTLNILQRLKDFGFTIAASDLNDTGQKNFVYLSANIPVYRELTLIRKANYRTYHNA